MAEERGSPSSVAEMQQLIQFLEDNVVRLNVELSRYQDQDQDYHKAKAGDPYRAKGGVPYRKDQAQSKYDPSSLSFGVGDPIPPWLIDSQHLSPLLASYDMRISELEEEARQLRARVKQLEAENLALKRAPASSHQNPQPPVFVQQQVRGRRGDEDEGDMQERLALLQEENDVLLEQQRLTQQELDALRKDLVSATSGYRDREEAVLKATVMQAKATALEKEKDALEDQLAKKRGDLASHSASAASYKKSLDELSAQKDILVKDNNELLAREKQMIGINAALDQDVKNLSEYQRLAEHERENLTKEREDLFNQLVSLERTLGECERREHAAVQALQKAIAAAEEAKLQKEQSVIREQQASKDVRRLTDKLTGLQADIREHYTKEIVEIRAQHKGQLDRSQEEIRVLTAEQGDLKALLDRAVRDKRSVEAEVSRLQREPHQEMERYQGEISRAQALALALQNERDALAAQLEGLAASEMTARRALEKERSTAVHHSEEAVRKVKRLETDLILSQEERHKLKQQLENLHKTHQELAIEKNSQLKAVTQELTRVKKEYEVETRELANKLDERIEGHSKSEQQYQGLLDEQHRMRERWREETKTATVRFEHIVQEQKGENEQLRTRIDDLAGRLAGVLADNELLSREHQDSVAILKQLRSQISLAEHHLNEALVREQSIRHDNSSLMAQLDQMALKQSMLLRVHPPPRDHRELDDDSIIKLQLDNANKEIDVLHEQVSNLKVEKRKLMRKLQLIKKGVLEKMASSREDS